MPSKDFYVRAGRDEPLFGPLSYAHANEYARWLSTEEQYAELVTILGERGGDPPVSPRIFVDGIYILGKKTLSGRAAQFHSEGRRIEDLL